MRAVWVVLLIASGGCDKLFGLNKFGDPIDASDVSADTSSTVDAPDWGFECFDGTFSTAMIDSTTFDVIMDSGVTIATSAGRVIIVPPTQAQGQPYGIVSTQLGYDLTDGMVEVELFSITGDHAEAELGLSSATNGNLRYGISISVGQALFFTYTGGSQNDLKTIQFTTPVPHYLRFRHSSATNEIIYEISSDGNGWTSFSQPEIFDITNTMAQFDAGAYMPSTAPGQATFDNFQFFSHRCFH